MKIERRFGHRRLDLGGPLDIDLQDDVAAGSQVVLDHPAGGAVEVAVHRRPLEELAPVPALGKLPLGDEEVVDPLLLHRASRTGGAGDGKFDIGTQLEEPLDDGALTRPGRAREYVQARTFNSDDLLVSAPKRTPRASRFLGRRSDYRRSSWRDSMYMREFNATHDIRGITGEIERSVRLEPGEKILVDARIRWRAGSLSQPVGWLRLTTSRLLLLKHHLAGPDRILEIPVGDLDPGATMAGSWITIGYLNGTARETLRLRPFGWNGALGDRGGRRRRVHARRAESIRRRAAPSGVEPPVLESG